MPNRVAGVFNPRPPHHPACGSPPKAGKRTGQFTKIPVPKDLQTPKKSLDDFYEVTKRVLGHLPDIVSERVTARDYNILSSVVAGTSKYARPINNNLFIFDNSVFDTKYKKFLSIIECFSLSHELLVKVGISKTSFGFAPLG